MYPVAMNKGLDCNCKMIKQFSGLRGRLTHRVEIHAAGLRSALGSASKNAREVVERLSIAALLGLSASESIVVDAAAAGIEAAQAGRFPFGGPGPRERVGAAEVIFPSLATVHLTDLLYALGSKPYK